MTKTGYLSFMAEPPMVGLRMQPGYAPDPNIESFDAAGYFKALCANEDRAAIETDVAEHHQAMEDAVEAGDMEDADEPDFVMEISVSDDGTIKVFHEQPRYVCEEFHISEVYEAFGMEMPKP